MNQKAVLASIKPKYCELIASGKKTVEICKNRPKIDVPFKCYIYCTGSDIHSALVVNSLKTTLFRCCNYKTAIPSGGKIGNGKVIGEFICDDVVKFTAEFTDGNTYEDIRYHYLDENDEEQEMIIVSNEWNNPNNCWLCKESCLSFDNFRKYIGADFHSRPFYAWHISDLVIYDKPKELSEFLKYNRSGDDCNYQHLPFLRPNSCRECMECALKRPPQS